MAIPTEFEYEVNKFRKGANGTNGKHLTMNVKTLMNQVPDGVKYTVEDELTSYLAGYFRGK